MMVQSIRSRWKNICKYKKKQIDRVDAKYKSWQKRKVDQIHVQEKAQFGPRNPCCSDFLKVAMTPEQQQEGPRLRHFRQTLQKMLQASMKQSTYLEHLNFYSQLLCRSSDKIDETFQFNLAPAQLSRLEQCLATEFEATAEKIKVILTTFDFETYAARCQANFEKTLELHELPPKLNKVDEVLRALHPDHKPEPRSDIDPEILIKTQLAPAKAEMINRLKESIAQVAHIMV